jgi:hypothetical protein
MDRKFQFMVAGKLIQQSDVIAEHFILTPDEWGKAIKDPDAEFIRFQSWE